MFVCIINGNGIVFQDKYGVLTPELEQMLSVMMQYNVEEICMESTSIYWMPVWRVLENYVILKLVNPYFINNFRERKASVKDAEWIATCLLKDLIKGSYVPGDLIQQLRPNVPVTAKNRLRGKKTPSNVPGMAKIVSPGTKTPSNVPAMAKIISAGTKTVSGSFPRQSEENPPCSSPQLWREKTSVMPC